MSKDLTSSELQALSSDMKANGNMSHEEFCAHLEHCTEHMVVVHLSNGDSITTRIHGTEKDIRSYYRVGSVLNIGVVQDLLTEITQVDILDA